MAAPRPDRSSGPVPRRGAVPHVGVVKFASPNRPPSFGSGPVPQVLKDVVTETITEPQLPLALLVVVVLFLLVQNRIDRRDPKLASAPLEAEPELDFGPVWKAGGAPA